MHGTTFRALKLTFQVVMPRAESAFDDCLVIIKINIVRVVRKKKKKRYEKNYKLQSVKITLYTQLRIKDASCELISAKIIPLCNITSSIMNRTRTQCHDHKNTFLVPAY